MVGGTIMGYLGGLHFWWPKISGRLYPEGWAQVCRPGDFRRFQSDFFPAVFSGLSGHAAALLRLPRRVSSTERHVLGGRLDPRRRLSHSDGLFLLVDALRPARRRQSMGRERLWNGQTPSPPPTENFDYKPRVSQPPYAYDEEEQKVV